MLLLMFRHVEYDIHPRTCDIPTTLRGKGLKLEKFLRTNKILKALMFMFPRCLLFVLQI